MAPAQTTPARSYKMPFFCHYCGQEKPDTERSTEHVLPEALGGRVDHKRRNPFTLDVCERCNNACGLYVDGPFARSWLTQADRLEHGMRYVDLAQDPLLPFICNGECNQVQWEGKVCDEWNWHSSVTLFHLHERYPDEDARPEVGPPLGRRRREVDPGFVIVFDSVANEAWRRCLYRSIQELFKEAPIYSVSQRPMGPPTLPIPENLAPLVARLSGLSSQRPRNGVRLDPHSGDRFLGKLALGLGCIWLHPDFRTSSDATRLRNFLWAKTPAARSAHGVRMSSFFENLKRADPPGTSEEDRIGWLPGHVFLFKTAADHLLLSIWMYGGQRASIVVSSTSSHWQGQIGDTPGSGGDVILVAPGCRRSFGPVHLSAYLKAREEGGRVKEPDGVGTFIHEVETLPSPPPLDWEEPPGSSQ